MNPEAREKLIKFHLVGSRRGASQWALIYTFISAPLTVAFAIGGHWGLALVGLLGIALPFVTVWLENRVYPESPPDDGEAMDRSS